MSGTTLAPIGEELLRVTKLSVEFPAPGGWVEVVRDVSFTVRVGATLGVVGESGSGKSVTALAVLGLIGKRGGRVTAGSAVLGGQDLTKLPSHELRRVLGAQASIVFQQPMRSLNPAFTIGEQIAETVRTHRKLSRREAKTRAITMLERVRIPDPERRAKQYPHQYSGGMLQRAMIAMALACEPRLLIADEPTTALDVTVQAAVLDLLDELQRELTLSIVLISHDLGVIARMSDEILVMYGGEVVEHGPAGLILTDPRHPYTSGLLASTPTGKRHELLASIPGSVPASNQFPSGCRFRTRCPFALSDLCDHPIELERSTEADTRCVRCARVGVLNLTEAVWT